MNRWIKHKFSRKTFYPLHITPVRAQTQHTRPAIAAHLSKDSLEHKGQNQRLIMKAITPRSLPAVSFC